jgi:hypothetical protein
LIELVHQGIPEHTDIRAIHSGKGKEKEQPRDDSFIAILFFILNISADVDPLAMSSPSYSSSDMEFKQIGLSKKDKIIVGTFDCPIFATNSFFQLSSIYSTISGKSSIFIRDTPVRSLLPLNTF